MSHYTNQVQKSHFSPNIETVKSIVNSKHLITAFTTLVHVFKGICWSKCKTDMFCDRNRTAVWTFRITNVTLHRKKWSQQLSPCTQSQYGLFFWSTTALKQRTPFKTFQVTRFKVKTNLAPEDGLTCTYYNGARKIMSKLKMSFGIDWHHSVKVVLSFRTIHTCLIV